MASSTDPALSPQQAMADWVRKVHLDRDALHSEHAVEKWERTTCRACGTGVPKEFLSLGGQPPANALLRPDELNNPEPHYPLSVRLCENCGMVQLGHVVPAPLLYRSYLFFTSSSQRMADHFGELMSDAAREFVRPGGLIVEIGSNDGTALSAIDRRDVRLLGVDPARNVAVMAAARGVPTVSEFFSEPLAQEIARVGGTASLVVACNVLGHVDDLDDFCRGVKEILAPDGAFVFEVPYVGDLFDHLEYDTIYHEHLSYFAVNPLAVLLNRHGLRLERVQFFTVHGGTIRCTAKHGNGASPRVQEIIEGEQRKKMREFDTIQDISQRIASLKLQLRKKLTDLRSSGKKIMGYGAPAKGTVVLNYCGLGVDLVPMVTDSTPSKQGYHIPGTHQPIVSPSVIAQERPDVMLLLAWNHADEIKEREAAFIAGGGVFVTPHLRSF